jgi:hypothetical protein
LKGVVRDDGRTFFILGAEPKKKRASTAGKRRTIA